MEENKKLIVADTSVFIKWLIEETENVKEAVKIKEDYLANKIKILIPSVCLWEINNFLGRKFAPQKAAGIFSTFLLYQFKEAVMNTELAFIAFRIMQSDAKISFYDASFHALALHSGATYITADQKYYKQTKNWKNIQLLRDYK